MNNDKTALREVISVSILDVRLTYFKKLKKGNTILHIPYS